MSGIGSCKCCLTRGNVANNFGHARAVELLPDLCVDQEIAAWELGISYLRGDRGLPINFQRAEEYLIFVLKQPFALERWGGD